MRVAVLGPADPLSRGVARELTDHPLIDEVVTADESSKEKSLPGCDVAVGCYGWDLAADEAAALSAVNEGVPYISSSISLEGPEFLKSCQESAKQAGVPVVAGTSWTPGLTGLLAFAGAEEVGSAHEIRIAWLGSSAGLLGDSATALMMHSFSSPAVTFKNGAFGRDLPGGIAEDVFFPQPVGWRTVRLCSSMEAANLPSLLPSIRRLTTKGALAEHGLDALIRTTARWSAELTGSASRRAGKLVRPVIPSAGRLRRNRPSWSALRVDVAGDDGSVSFGVVDQLSNLLISPLVVAVEMVGRGLVSGTGVMGAEAAFDPKVFFQLLDHRGVKIARLMR